MTHDRPEATRRIVVLVSFVLLVLLVFAAAFTLAGCTPESPPASSGEAGPAAAASAGATSRATTEAGDWPVYGGDAASRRYSPLDRITADDFDDLQVAWTWSTGAGAWREGWMKEHGVTRIDDAPSLLNFQLTPLVIDGVMYGVDPTGVLFALDAATGRPIWKNAEHTLPGPNAGRAYRTPKSRGVAFWRDGDDARIVFATFDGRLVEVAAGTGATVTSFGRGGEVDLALALRNADPERLQEFYVSSPVAIHGDAVVVGAGLSDWPRGLPGLVDDLRAYDVRTGELLWAFHVVPTEGEPATATWEGESWRRMGGANAWAPKSIDVERGLLYAGTSAPTSDFYGGVRPGDNLYADSLLCIDVATGELVWHAQITHHSVWDYDLPAAPNLVDLEVDGRTIAAVAIATKQGFVFVFDRVTGEPVWPIEERPVPASDLEGEQLSPTQPFPTRPPPFERQEITPADIVDWTPAVREAALAELAWHRTGPLYTPPAVGTTVLAPGNGGGAGWRGAGLDPETGVLYVPSVNAPAVLPVFEAPPELERGPYVVGIPKPLVFEPPDHAGDLLPVVKPPWSQVSAIDLQRGELRWQTPLGRGPRDHPVFAGLDPPLLGSGAQGCVLVTESLVIATEGPAIIRTTFVENKLWAYDKGSGRVVGELMLPGKPMGCPMTYLAGDRQYLGMAVKGAYDLPTVIALALPDERAEGSARNSESE